MPAYMLCGASLSKSGILMSGGYREAQIREPVNPFTDLINMEPKSEPELYIFFSNIYNMNKNNGNTFLPGTWYGLRNQDILQVENWRLLPQ